MKEQIKFAILAIVTIVVTINAILATAWFWDKIFNL
jgi:hypothetical protein